MNVQTIQMDPRVARVHYADYRKACRRHREAREEERARRERDLGSELRKVRVEKTLIEQEDEILLGAYRALTRGERIIDVHKVVAAAGLDDQKLPRLALAPAHGKRCWINASQTRITFRVQRNEYLCPKADKVEVSIRANEEMGRYLIASWQWREEHKHPRVDAVNALVPAIPARFRPDNLKDYYILWEAEWKPCAPTDPLLLKRINARFYTVVAQWDLSELEKSVLEGRL